MFFSLPSCYFLEYKTCSSIHHFHIHIPIIFSSFIRIVSNLFLGSTYSQLFSPRLAGVPTVSAVPPFLRGRLQLDLVAPAIAVAIRLGDLVVLQVRTTRQTIFAQKIRAERTVFFGSEDPKQRWICLGENPNPFFCEHLRRGPWPLLNRCRSTTNRPKARSTTRATPMGHSCFRKLLRELLLGPSREFGHQIVGGLCHLRSIQDLVPDDHFHHGPGRHLEKKHHFSALLPPHRE